MSATTRSLAWVVAGLMTPVLVVGCGSDEPATEPAATSTPTVSAPPTTPDASPSPTRSTRPSPTATATRSEEPVPSESPDDDENGELAGQLIIEYPGTPLRRTSSTAPDENVEAFQIRLNEVGFTVAVTGVFDASTERVVKRFQTDTGLPASGVVDADTWAALFTFE